MRRTAFQKVYFPFRNTQKFKLYLLFTNSYELMFEIKVSHVYVLTHLALRESQPLEYPASEVRF